MKTEIAGDISADQHVMTERICSSWKQASQLFERWQIKGSFLKTRCSLVINKVRGLKNVACYALYSLLCLVLNREVAENLGRPDKAVSPTYFNT
jgi:hypothetical protein